MAFKTSWCQGLADRLIKLTTGNKCFLCPPFVTPGTEMSLGKEAHTHMRARARTHTRAHTLSRPGRRTIREVLRQKEQPYKCGSRKRERKKEETKRRKAKDRQQIRERDERYCSNGEEVELEELSVTVKAKAF